MKSLLLLTLGTWIGVTAYGYTPDPCNELYKEEVVCTVTGPGIAQGGLWLSRDYYEQNSASSVVCANAGKSVLSAELTVSLVGSTYVDGDGMATSYGPSDDLFEEGSSFTVERINNVNMWEPQTLEVNSKFSVPFKVDSEMDLQILVGGKPMPTHLQCKVVN